jgi:hypothetical protein
MKVIKLPGSDDSLTVLDEWGNTEGVCRRRYPIPREVIEQAALTFAPGDSVEIPGGEICIVKESRGTEVFVKEFPHLGLNPLTLTKIE